MNMHFNFIPITINCSHTEVKISNSPQATIDNSSITTQVDKQVKTIGDGNNVLGRSDTTTQSKQLLNNETLTATASNIIEILWMGLPEPIKEMLTNASVLDFLMKVALPAGQVLFNKNCSAYYNFV